MGSFFLVTVAMGISNCLAYVDPSIKVNEALLDGLWLCRKGLKLNTREKAQTPSQLDG